MQIRRYCLFCILMLSLSFASTGNAEPTNLHSLKQVLIQYYDSGNYTLAITRQDEKAQIYLNERIAENAKRKNKQKLAIVFDIDETSLSNYQDMKALDFGGTVRQLEEAEAKGQDPVIAPTLTLYNYARAHGVATFFITGRPEFLHAATVENLHKAGYNDWDGLYLKPGNYKQKSAIPYKTAVRKKITEKGYDIVLTVGDQQSDLLGGYADKGIKLPNPYYYIG